MKTTNYEISKQLKEAGFEASYIYAWYSDSEGLPWVQEIQYVKPTAINKYGKEVKLTFTAPAYDLETILDALPKKIEFKEKEYCFWMQWSGSSDCYLMGYVHGNLRATELEVWREDENKNSESLADTAGRMWLELKKKNLL